MTNKEALSYLANKANIGEPIDDDFDDIAYGCYVQLHNELEILELLKKAALVSVKHHNSNVERIQLTFTDPLSDEENKVLENFVYGQ